MRALAQRSADAAKEIKDADLAPRRSQVETRRRAGRRRPARRWTSIVDQVDRDQRAWSPRSPPRPSEQATGLQQVNTAVNQMDQVTQQNAAMVEESTAATHSLSKAGQLAELVGQFRLGKAAGFGGLRRELKKAAPHAFRANSPAAAGERGGVHIAVDNQRSEAASGIPPRTPRTVLAAAANGRPVSAGSDSAERLGAVLSDPAAASPPYRDHHCSGGPSAAAFACGSASYAVQSGARSR